VTFSVADTGIGIALEDQERIFQEWAQVEGKLQKSVKGTGLGLPLSRKLAQLLVKAVLGNSNFRFLEASGAREGLLKAREDQPNAVILDLSMPDLSGFEVLKRLKGDPHTAQIPVIIYTSKVLLSDECEMLKDAVAILSKESKSRELSLEQFADAFKRAGIPIGLRPTTEATQHV
jgi:CheY-like chemotaxis protein